MSALQTLLGILAQGDPGSGPMSGETLGLPTPNKIPPSKVSLDPNLDQAIRVMMGGGGGMPAPGMGGGSPAPAAQPHGLGGLIHGLAGAFTPGAAQLHAQEIAQRGQIADNMEKARMLSEILQAKRESDAMQHQKVMEELAGRKETEAERKNQEAEAQRKSDAERQRQEFEVRMGKTDEQIRLGQERSEQQQRQFETTSAQRDRAEAAREREATGRQAIESARTQAMIQKMNNPPPTGDEVKRADLAKNWKENADNLEDIVNRRPELFGPGAGRITRIKTFIGTNDPDIAKINNIKHNFGMVQQSTHGQRAFQGIEGAANAVVNAFDNGPDAIKAALMQGRQSVSTFESDVAAKQGQTVEQYEAPFKRARGKGGQPSGSPGVTHIWTPDKGLQPVAPQQQGPR